MMNEDSNFDFLVEYIVSKVVEWLMRDNNIGLDEALLLFCNSQTFEKLSERKTDMFIESPAYVYEIFKEEQRRGTLRNICE